MSQKFFLNKKIDIILFDLTPEDIKNLGFYVVRVYIPKLVQLGVPAYPFLGNERLYTVPKKLGYATHKMKERELNKMPHPVP